MKAYLEGAQSERNTLWEAMKPLALHFHRPKDSEKRWVDIVKEMPNCFESYVCGAAKVCVRNVLGTLRVLYPVVDLRQVAIDYDDEGHLVAVKRAEKELDGLTSTITDELYLRMEKPDE